MADKIRELLEAISDKTKEHIKVSTSVATVKTVNWEQKTMVATGVSDDLDYHDVLLGLGSVQIKPKVGSLCLIGIIENKDSETFLIDAEEVDEISLKAVSITINDGLNNGLVKINDLMDNLNDLKQYCEDLKSAVSTGLNAVGEGGAASGTAASEAFDTAMTGKSITVKDMENNKVKH